MTTGTHSLHQHEILLADTVTVGTALTVAGVTIDGSSLAVSGLTASADELNYNDTATPGTAVASKTLVLGANLNVDTIAIAASGLKIGPAAGTAVTTTAAELNVLAGVTAGTTAASKGVVLDAAESLAWATTDATASETCTLTITDTRTGAGAIGWAAKFDLEANVALGSYANGAYGIIAFGASGKATGLAAGVCSETVLSAGCTEGTYGGLEVELGMPTGARTGTATSLLYLSVYGADASTFDTSGYLFHLTGVTRNTDKMLAPATTGATARPVDVLRVKTPQGDRYIGLYSTVAIAA